MIFWIAHSVWIIIGAIIELGCFGILGSKILCDLGNQGFDILFAAQLPQRLHCIFCWNELVICVLEMQISVRIRQLSQESWHLILVNLAIAILINFFIDVSNLLISKCRLGHVLQVLLNLIIIEKSIRVYLVDNPDLFNLWQNLNFFWNFSFVLRLLIEELIVLQMVRQHFHRVCTRLRVLLPDARHWAWILKEHLSSFCRIFLY